MSEIPIDDEGLDRLKNMYDSAVVLFKEVNTTLARHEEEFLSGHLKYTESVTQTIGIIAGFGFTAVARVEEMWLFALGELVIVSSICYGLLRTRYTYTKTIDVLGQQSSKASKVLAKRTTYIGNLYAQAVAKNTIPSDAKDEIDALNKEMMEALTPPDRKEDDHFKDNLIEMIIAAAIGILLVLCSFMKVVLGIKLS